MKAATVVCETGQFVALPEGGQADGLSTSGLVSRENTTGNRIQRGAITKTGNAHLRRVLVESAWTYQHRPNVQGRVLRRQKALALSDEAKRIAWKAQQRLHKRFIAMAARGKRRGTIVTALARELHSASCGPLRYIPKRSSSNRRRRLKILKFPVTAVPVTAEGIRKGEPSRRTMRYGSRTQPARSVRGSSRRIMSMRFRPAYISGIKLRASIPVVIGTAAIANLAPGTPAGTCSGRAAHRVRAHTRTVLAGKGSLRPRQKPARPCLLRAVPARTFRDGRLRREHLAVPGLFKKGETNKNPTLRI